MAVGGTYTTRAGGQVTLESVQRRTEGLGQFDGPPAEGVYLEVLIAGVAGSEGGSLNPFEFNIVDAAGFRYGPTFGDTSVPTLSFLEIPPGGLVRGAILFDVPDGPVQLVWAQVFPEAQPAVWAIP